MALRAAARPLRKLFSTSAPAAASSTSTPAAAQKLPFEKELFKSDILDKARRHRRRVESLQFWCDIGVVVVATSVVAKLGYYAVYGKKGGGAALPPRYETSASSS